MTRVSQIQTNNDYKKPVLTPKTTGYLAAGALLVTTARYFSKSKPVVKSHKTLGIITALLTLLHIGVTEFYHHKYKKM